jgi:hypothetical protein
MTLAEAQSIQGKRANSRIEAIRGRKLMGKNVEDDRAFIRVGKRNTQVLIGADDLSTWTDEELRRGRQMDKNGRWQGKDPVIVPKVIHDELVRRTLAKANALMRDNLEKAVEVLTEIVVGADVEPKDKLTAIKIIMDRVMGKEPQKVHLSGEAKWQVALHAGIVSLPDALGDPDYIDVNETDEEEEDDVD